MTTTPESYPRYTREVITPDPALLDAIASQWVGDSDKEGDKHPVINGLILFAFFASLIGAITYYASKNWPLTLLIGSLVGAAFGGLLLVATLASNKKVRTNTAALKRSTRAVRHTLDLSGPHRFVFHDHGILILVPLAPGHTFCHDISNCADHPWDSLIKDAMESNTLKTRWIWYDIEPDTGKSYRLQHLTLEGPALEVLEGYEDLAPVAEIMGDELYPDDYVAKIDYDQLMARLTHLQNTVSLNEKPPSSTR